MLALDKNHLYEVDASADRPRKMVSISDLSIISVVDHSNGRFNLELQFTKGVKI